MGEKRGLGDTRLLLLLNEAQEQTLSPIGMCVYYELIPFSRWGRCVFQHNNNQTGVEVTYEIGIFSGALECY
jgi:hypothetical protein